jgi:hypothetical protein
MIGFLNELDQIGFHIVKYQLGATQARGIYNLLVS